MIHALLPDARVRPLSFYLAMEEYLAARDDRDYFFMWQVEPTVIIGRNQHLLSEVNTDYCHSHGINIVRRRSGGGCVYADMNNVMFSHITTSASVTDTFSRYTHMVADMLRQLGIDAHAGGRNDILIDGRKVSGNAFYHRRGRAIVHGTMLYNTDIQEMLHAITPSHAKLTSKGVESVRSRVINITEVSDISLPDFKRRSAEILCDEELVLTADDITAVEQIEHNYLKPEWLAGYSHQAESTTVSHIDGVGQLEVSIKLKGDIIDDIAIMGDYFLLSDIDAALLDHLRGITYSRGAIEEALRDVDTSTVIASLTTDKFINTIIS